MGILDFIKPNPPVTVELDGMKFVEHPKVRAYRLTIVRGIQKDFEELSALIHDDTIPVEQRYALTVAVLGTLQNSIDSVLEDEKLWGGKKFKAVAKLPTFIDLKKRAKSRKQADDKPPYVG